MSVQIQLIIAIQKQVDVFAHRTVKELIVICVCQIHTDGSTKEDANYANVITLDLLVNRATCIRANACVARDSRDANVIAVRSDILIIQAAIDAVVIAMAQ